MFGTASAGYAKDLKPVFEVGWKLWWRNEGSEKAGCDLELGFRRSSTHREPLWQCRALIVDSSSSISERGQNRRSNFIYVSFNIKYQSVFCLLDKEIGPFLGSWMLQGLLIYDFMSFPLKVERFFAITQKHCVQGEFSAFHVLNAFKDKFKGTLMITAINQVYLCLIGNICIFLYDLFFFFFFLHAFPPPSYVCIDLSYF